MTTRVHLLRPALQLQYQLPTEGDVKKIGWSFNAMGPSWTWCLAVVCAIPLDSVARRFGGSDRSGLSGGIRALICIDALHHYFSRSPQMASPPTCQGACHPHCIILVNVQHACVTDIRDISLPV
jgi:hypothetical protein